MRDFDKDFKEWLLNEFFAKKGKVKPSHKLNVLAFKNIPVQMQFGVLQEFFSGKGIIVDIQPVLDYDDKSYTKLSHYMTHIFKLGSLESFEVEEEEELLEAMQSSMDKAKECYGKI